MAIVINGSGTITGLSVGGLPDGIVDNDMLAGSISDSKITGLSSSKLTGALPALDGSNLTGVSAGKILQVKSAIWHPTSAVSITNQMWVTDLDIAITPTNASSRFVSYITFGMLQQNADAKYIEVRYYKDSTTIDGGGYGLGYSELNPGSLTNNYKPHTYVFEHNTTAGNTTSRTYKIRMNTDGDWKFHNNARNTHVIMEYAV